MPASRTNKESSAEYMSGWGMPVSSSAFSIPFSAKVQRSAYCAEKLMFPAAMSTPFCSCWRSLSFDVMETILAPRLENSASTVLERNSSGPVIITALRVPGSR